MPLEISHKRWIQGFRTVFVITLIAVSYLALTPIEIPQIENFWDKSNHLAAFITLAFLLDFSTSGNSIKWLGLACYGMLIEIAQWFTEYRYFELSDILADCIGIAIYVILRGQLARTPWFGNLRHTLDDTLDKTLDNTLDKTLKDNI